jgi:DNA repair photolyase
VKATFPLTRSIPDFTIVSRLRKGRLLTRARFGCLRGIPAINITNGCLFQCAYCYARGYSQAPPKGAVQLYANLPDLLEEELRRKKVIPPWVILNTSSDCFQPHPDILDLTFRVIQILLNHGIGLSFLTKGEISRKCLDLFRRSPQKVLAQIGVVSLSERYRKEYEPFAPPAEERLGNIEALRRIGILPEVRIDPIIPFVTDTEETMEVLLSRLRESGIKRVTLSYLHLRPAIERQLMNELSPRHRRLIETCFGLQGWKEVGSSSMTKLLPKTVREKGYSRIKKMAEAYGIQAFICQCKNPDLDGDLCSSGRAWGLSREKAPKQLPLFRC